MSDAPRPKAARTYNPRNWVLECTTAHATFMVTSFQSDIAAWAEFNHLANRVIAHDGYLIAVSMWHGGAVVKSAIALPPSARTLPPPDAEGIRRLQGIGPAKRPFQSYNSPDALGL